MTKSDVMPVKTAFMLGVSTARLLADMAVPFSSADIEAVPFVTRRK